MSMTTIERIEQYYDAREPLLIIGPPGIGKSQMVQQIAQKAGVEYLDIRLSLMDPVDLRGLPFVEREQKSVEWAAPDFMRSEGSGIIHWEEINLAPIAVQNAAMQVLTEYQIGPHKLSRDIWQVSSGNRPEHKAHVNPISAPLLNRFNVLELDGPNKEEWTTYATRQRFHEDVIAFIHFRSDLLYQAPKAEFENFPTPRGWERVSRLLYGNRDDLLFVSGAVGKGAAIEFLAFREQRAILPDLDKLLEGKVQFNFQDHPISISYAAATSLAMKTLERGLSHDLVNKCARVINGILPEIASQYYLTLVRGTRDQNVKALPFFLQSPEASKWMNQHMALVEAAHSLN